MFADGSHWCDWCGIELLTHSRTGRLTAIGQTEPSKPLLSGGRVCGECDAAVKRKDTTYAAKTNRGQAKYVRDIEAGRKDAPYTGRVQLQSAFGKLDVAVPVKLKVNGDLRPETRKLLKAPTS